MFYARLKGVPTSEETEHVHRHDTTSHAHPHPHACVCTCAHVPTPISSLHCVLEPLPYPHLRHTRTLVIGSQDAARGGPVGSPPPAGAGAQRGHEAPSVHWRRSQRRVTVHRGGRAHHRAGPGVQAGTVAYSRASSQGAQRAADYARHDRGRDTGHPDRHHDARPPAVLGEPTGTRGAGVVRRRVSHLDHRAPPLRAPCAHSHQQHLKNKFGGGYRLFINYGPDASAKAIALIARLFPAAKVDAMFRCVAAACGMQAHYTVPTLPGSAWS